METTKKQVSNIIRSNPEILSSNKIKGVVFSAPGKDSVYIELESVHNNNQLSAHVESLKKHFGDQVPTVEIKYETVTPKQEGKIDPRVQEIDEKLVVRLSQAERNEQMSSKMIEPAAVEHHVDVAPQTESKPTKNPENTKGFSYSQYVVNLISMLSIAYIVLNNISKASDLLKKSLDMTTLSDMLSLNLQGEPEVSEALQKNFENSSPFEKIQERRKMMGYEEENEDESDVNDNFDFEMPDVPKPVVTKEKEPQSEKNSQISKSSLTSQSRVSLESLMAQGQATGAIRHKIKSVEAPTKKDTKPNDFIPSIPKENKMLAYATQLKTYEFYLYKVESLNLDNVAQTLISKDKRIALILHDNKLSTIKKGLDGKCRLKEVNSEGETQQQYSKLIEKMQKIQPTDINEEKETGKEPQDFVLSVIIPTMTGLPSKAAEHHAEVGKIQENKIELGNLNAAKSLLMRLSHNTPQPGSPQFNDKIKDLEREVEFAQKRLNETSDPNDQEKIKNKQANIKKYQDFINGSIFQTALKKTSITEALSGKMSIESVEGSVQNFYALTREYCSCCSELNELYKILTSKIPDKQKGFDQNFAPNTEGEKNSQEERIESSKKPLPFLTGIAAKLKHEVSELKNDSNGNTSPKP